MAVSAINKNGRPGHTSSLPRRRRLRAALIIFAVCLPFAGTLLAMVLLWQRMVSWSDIAIMIGMYCFTGLGITMGYHRMLTHRSFEAHPVVKFVLLVAGSMAIEGPARTWARTHIKHHAQSDKEDDPHSPLAGFWHAHMGWFVDGKDVEETYGAWLSRDPMVMFVSRMFPIWAVLTFLIPFVIGGWTGLLWGGLVRVFLCHHVTWSINSVCHTFGRRMFETSDVSRNNWIFGIFGFGEGWHNNHHAFQRSAFHGMRWWQIDISGYLIRLLELMRLAKNVCRIPMDTQQTKLIRKPAETT